jgi:hypothetical protein
MCLPVLKVIPPDSDRGISLLSAPTHLVQSILFIVPKMTTVDVEGRMQLVTNMKEPVFIQLALCQSQDAKFVCSNPLCHAWGHVPTFPKKLVHDTSVRLNMTFTHPSICCRTLFRYARESLNTELPGQLQQQSPRCSKEDWEIIQDLLQRSKPWVKCDERSSNMVQQHDESNTSESATNSASSPVVLCNRTPSPGASDVELVAQVSVLIQ